MGITPLVYSDWERDYYEKLDDCANIPPALALKRYLVQVIEKNLSDDLQSRKDEGKG